MICGLIMAGGVGSRFWPLSTEDKPKQFLKLVGEETMLQLTVKRILPIIPMERIFICTGRRYINLVKQQLPTLPTKNIIVEPEGRNTAPCIALSAFLIEKYINNSTMLVLPSDHLIADENSFRKIIISSDSFLSKNPQAIVTIGMNATRPETGYGYIRKREQYDNLYGFEFYKVDEFVEKPSLDLAQKYMDDESYLWNSGMFMWKTDTILNNFRELLPSTYNVLNKVFNINESDFEKRLEIAYKQTDKISVDYGILEHSNSIYVVPGDIGWDDVGSWEALERYRERDERGNICIGKCGHVEGSNNLVVSSNQNIIIDNLNDIYVFESNGNIIVGQKERIGKVKELKGIIV